MTRRLADRLLVGLFLAVSAAPAARGLVGPAADVLAGENRTPAPPPRLDGPSGWRGLPDGFEAFFNDRVGWRDRLAGWHALAEVRLFHVASSSQVVLGRH